MLSVVPPLQASPPAPKHLLFYYGWQIGGSAKFGRETGRAECKEYSGCLPSAFLPTAAPVGVEIPDMHAMCRMHGGRQEAGPCALWVDCNDLLWWLIGISEVEKYAGRARLPCMVSAELGADSTQHLACMQA